MPVIALIQQKGGVGKSSVAGNLAGELVELGKSVAVLDLDPQQSLLTWAEFGVGLLSRIVETVDTKNPRSLSGAIERIGKRAERIILDCPPGLPDTGIMAALLCDLALLPVSPSPLDFKAIKEAVELVREARNRRKDKRPAIAFVPSRVEENTILGRDLSESLKQLGEPVLPAISKRIAFAECVLKGLTLREYAPANPGVQEFNKLALAVERMLTQ
ncbi:MAG: ParA family protein [Acidobacteriota bacterium]|nr:ParA family protein [Acidobacteriota bacterium]